MHDEVDTVDRELSTNLKSYVARSVLVREPEQVVARALASRPTGPRLRFPRWAAGSVVVLVLSVIAIGAITIGPLGGDSGSEPATALVGDGTYYIRVARNLNLPLELLESHGTATQIEFDAAAIVSPTVYAIRGIDPGTVLILKLTPNAGDDAGPLGEFLLLTRGPNALQSLCAYFDSTKGPIPQACR